MPRTFKIKTLFVPLSDREKKLVLLKKQTSGLNLTKVAVQGLSKSTIHRQLKLSNSFKKTCHNRQVFNEQEECELTNYLIVAQKLNHGLTLSDTRKLAYSFAKSNNIKMPSPWEVNEEAVKDCFPHS
jgi:transposase